ncbi:MAG: right-handed parallel beta-helix repeat-containing protein [Saprospiraceae bacterium]
MNIKYVLLLGILFTSTLAFSTTYYVSSDGDDSNSGLTINDSWSTILKVNGVNFSPGDSILFNRGDEWNNRLIISEAGDAVSNITYGAYGNGVRPIIDVQNLETGAIISYVSYITIEDLILKNSTNNALGFGVTGGCYNIIVQRVDIFDAGNNALSVSKGGDGVHIDNVSVYNAGNNGIYMNGSPANHLSNVVIENCYVSGTGGNDGIVVHEDGNGGVAGSNFVIKNNYAEFCAEQGYDITTGSNVLLYNNVSKNNQQGGVIVGHSANNVTIERHTSIDEPTQNTSAAINIGGTADNVVLKYSTIRGNGYHLLRVTISNVSVYNNTFAYGGGGAIIDYANEIENITFKNNIITTTLEGMSRIRFLNATRPPSHPTFYFDNNIYYSPTPVIIYSAATTSNYSFPNYQTTFSQDPNGYEIDPLFVDRVGADFHLTKNSPAIDSGFVWGGVEDYDGTMVPLGNGPDIGAFEYFCDLNVKGSTFMGLSSIASALDCAENGDTIYLSSQIINNTIEIGDTTIIIDKDIVIIASAPTTVDADNLTNCLSVSAGSQVVLKGMAIKNTDGIGIDNKGNLTLEDVAIETSNGIHIINADNSVLLISGNCNLKE